MFLDQLSPEVAEGVTTVGGGVLVVVLGWLAKTASRVVTVMTTKWDKDRAQQLAIANHFSETLDRGLRLIAAGLQQPEERATVPLKAEPISVPHSGPIRLPQ